MIDPAIEPDLASLLADLRRRVALLEGSTGKGGSTSSNGFKVYDSVGVLRSEMLPTGLRAYESDGSLRWSSTGQPTVQQWQSAVLLTGVSSILVGPALANNIDIATLDIAYSIDVPAGTTAKISISRASQTSSFALWTSPDIVGPTTDTSAASWGEYFTHINQTLSTAGAAPWQITTSLDRVSGTGQCEVNLHQLVFKPS